MLSAPLKWTEIAGWGDDNHGAAFEAFCVSAKRMLDKPYKTRALKIDAAALLVIARDAVETGLTTSAKRFFETRFQPRKILHDGFLTGYFEPELKASLVQSAEFSVPLLRQPPELVEVDDNNCPAVWNREIRFARKTEAGLEVFIDRGDIHAGALSGRGLELVWLQNKVDAFFVHVQGSARLMLDNGDVMRVTYAAKSGHHYTSLGKILCRRFDISPAKMTADVLRQWMFDHPDELDELLAQNRSYIFFKQVEGLQPDAGPIAAAKVSLIAGRSLAVDRTLHTFGTPVWIMPKYPLAAQGLNIPRLMMAHDTGSAIVGPARGDVFVGTGNEAGLIAGKIRHEATLVVLNPLPKSEWGE